MNRQVTTVHVSPREPASPDVQVISYAGSTAVGRLVAADGAATRMTGSRILAQRGVADQVRARLAGLLESVRVGDGMDPETDMGSLIDKADVTRVDGMVQAALAYAKAGGARRPRRRRRPGRG